LPRDYSTVSLARIVEQLTEGRAPSLGAVAPHCRGDLELIVSKALDPERERRYQSAAELATDLQRLLDFEPIHARPVSTVYQLRRLARRHRGVVVAVSAAFLAILIGLIATTYVQIRANSQLEQKNIDLDLARQSAQEQAAVAKAVNEFLNEDMLAAVAPSIEEGRGHDVTMRDALDMAAERIDAAAAPGGRFADKPLVEARIRATLTETYFKLGESKAAKPHAERALELTRGHLGAEHPEALSALENLGSLLGSLDQNERAEALLTECLEARRRVHGEESRPALASLFSLALLHKKLGRYDLAETMFSDCAEA
ncbi:MAG: tetratricopeptide repeat protein, partial [bacterium]|nr:tetratricopeptide repeat protein [bacterium]